MFQQFFQITKKRFNQLKNRLAETQNIVSYQNRNNDIEDIKRYLDDKDRRHYQNPEGDDVYSVTTVLDELEGEKWYLKKWRENNDGEGDNPDWKHILEYKRNRGTLAHYAALSSLREDMWSDDESSSLQEMYDRHGDQDFLYSVLADRAWVSSQDAFETLKENEEIEIDDVLHKDLEYFVGQFDKFCEEKNIELDTVYGVEKMFVVPPNGEHDGYGGQVDLIYRDSTTGDLVVSDLKTSKSIYDKHKYQAAAYAKALEKLDNVKVDRAEIVRINPDKEEYQVKEVNDFDQYWEEFAETTKKM